jgi:Cdc6-like AAA superfamily ATPase
MIKYFSIKQRAKKENHSYNTKRCVEVYFREKKTRQSKKEKSTYISKNKNILITGEVASGKTKELHKLYNQKENIYNSTKRTNNFIYFNCNISLSEILDIFEENLENTNQQIDIKDIQHHIENIEDQEETTDKRTMYKRVKELEQYSNGAILFVDDIHKASGRKLETLKHLLKNCKIWVVTAKSSHNINQNLQKSMRLKFDDTYYNFTLPTTQAVDATNILFIIFIIFLVTIGQTDMAILLMAGRFMLKQGTGK